MVTAVAATTLAAGNLNTTERVVRSQNSRHVRILASQQNRMAANPSAAG